MEKERFELFGEHCIKDNDTNARCQLLDAYKTCVILNEQEKCIKELQQSINNYKYAAFRASEFIKQNDELKAQITKCKKALNLMASDWCLIDNPNNPDAVAKQYMEKAERE